MFKRYSTSLLGGLIVTFCLFLGMHFLVKADYREKPKVKPVPPIIVGKVRDPELPTPQFPKPERSDDPPPPEPDIDLSGDEPDGITIGSRGFPPPNPGDPIGPKGFGLPEGDVQAITKFAPAYPQNLLSQDIEGYVIVQFTVTKLGTVENAVIIESTHSGFNKASLRAVKKFKYKPRVIDGQAVEVHNVIEKLSFEIEKS